MSFNCVICRFFVIIREINCFKRNPTPFFQCKLYPIKHCLSALECLFMLHCKVKNCQMQLNGIWWCSLFKDVVFFCDTSCLLNKWRQIIFFSGLSNKICHVLSEGILREKKRILTSRKISVSLTVLRGTWQWQPISEGNWGATSLNVGKVTCMLFTCKTLAREM